jgi:hypothetical protein
MSSRRKNANCRLFNLVRPAWILRLSWTLAIEVQPIPFAGSRNNQEFSMAKSKSKRTQARASGAGAAGQSKRARRTKNASASRDSRQQRSADATTPTHKKQRGGAPSTKDPSTLRRAPSEYGPEAGSVESGGGKERRDGRSDISTDEETGAVSRRPGGTGDVSFGNEDEGPEGPAR